MAQAIEFEIKGQHFKVDKLNAFQQFHVSRKIAPIIPTLIPVFMSIARAAKGSDANTVEGSDAKATVGDAVLAALSAPELFQPFADALAQLKDEDAEYVLNTCLAKVRRDSGGAWLPIWSEASRMATSEDLNDLSKLLPIVVRVIKENLGPFIAGFLTSQEAETTTA